MKNLFKFGFLGLALTLAVSACNSQPAETSAETENVDVISEDAAVDTAVVDTTVVDTTVADTNVVN